MTLDTRFQSILGRAKASADRRADEAELARRGALPSVELRAEALAAWEPLRSAVVAAVEQWNAELSKFGFGVTTSIEGRDQTGQILETLKIQTTGPEGRDYALTLSPVAAHPGHISYSGPKGNVINGASGTLPLFKATTDQVVDLALRHVEQHVK